MTSIDIAPANEKVICADFASSGFFDQFTENSFDQVLLLYVLSYMPDTTTRLEAIKNASKSLKLGGQLLIATPDSANEYKHRQWMKDWFEALAKCGLRKHSYSKETHFHGLCLVKVGSIEERTDLDSSFYIMQDKHN